MRSARVEIALRIVQMDSTANLQAIGICRQRLARCRFIARSEHDDVSTAQSIALVKFSEPRGGLIGDKVCAQRYRIITERAADDLLYFALVQIDAWPEHGTNLAVRPRPSQADRSEDAADDLPWRDEFGIKKKRGEAW